MKQIENPWIVGQLEEEEKCIQVCCECEAELFDGDIAYCIEGNYYCEDCIANKKQYLESEDD